MRWESAFEPHRTRRPAPVAARARAVLLAVMAALATASGVSSQGPSQGPGGSRSHVVLVTLDGARWQEVFGGLDLDVLRSVSGKTPVEETASYRRYWAATPEARREKLMPVLWSTLVRQHGTVFGNRTAGSVARVTNRHRFSYPGYNELLTGAPHDEVVNSNDERRYPFLTVLEWLRPTLRLSKEGVAVFGSWSTFNWIAEREEGAIAINAGFERYDADAPQVRQVNDLQFETVTPWASVRHDVYTHHFAMAHLATHRPRVLYVAYGETDDWAHDGRYDQMLDALHATDRRIGELWTWLQADAEYRDTTTLVLTVDHGRGRSAKDWTSHGAEVEGADEIWLGCFGARVRARGEARQHAPVEQRQVAATVAAAVGQDFRVAVPNAAPAVAACSGA